MYTENNIKINSGELVFQYMNLIQLSQDRFPWRIFVKTLINLPSIFLKASYFLDTCNNFNIDTAAFGYYLCFVAWNDMEQWLNAAIDISFGSYGRQFSAKEEEFSENPGLGNWQSQFRRQAVYEEHFLPLSWPEMSCLDRRLPRYPLQRVDPLVIRGLKLTLMDHKSPQKAYLLLYGKITECNRTLSSTFSGAFYCSANVEIWRLSHFHKVI